ncbi:MAG: protein-L-isoaspartate(D-aspartate) O-methyltransferase [Anaerolineales bacterium]|nr:protein-L-isoaspartate(D-aspartate) O-methyltransferase [Anaerolineales bacterium]
MALRSLWTLCLVLLLAACAAPPTPTVTPTVPSPPAPATTGATLAPTDDPYAEERFLMVARTIEARGVTNPDVLGAMRDVPRHAFVPEEYLGMAYADHPLPIGYGQTISQPYIVAWMTELLDLKAGDKVLEIGTGSGYQAAVLAQLGYVDVYSIEIIPELAESAAARLQALGYTQVKVKQGDGYYGWPEQAPFDAIIVTAAPDHLPAPLAAQLAEGGRLVIPIGPPGGYQSLWKFVNEGGELKAYDLGGVAFVPLTGEGTGIEPGKRRP